MTSLPQLFFSIYFAVTLAYAFQDCDIGIFLRFRTTGKVFNLTRFNAKSKTFQCLVRELLYADDADFVAHTEEDMQAIMDLFSKACTAFGLTISLKKTKVMLTPVPGHPYVEPNIFVEGKRLLSNYFMESYFVVNVRDTSLGNVLRMLSKAILRLLAQMSRIGRRQLKIDRFGEK